jgi:hypothetical protein
MTSEIDTSAIQPQQSPPPLQVGYFTSTLGMPPRAVANLRGHAPPRGDVGDWPLDDARVAHFETTVKLRKRISSAASLYKSLLALTAIGLVVMVPMTILSLTANAMRRNMGFALGPTTGVMVAFGVMYYIAYLATRKSQRWAPLTMFIIFVASGAMQIILAALSGFTFAQPPEIFTLIVVLLFSLGFAVVSWRAVAAIPVYLAQPAWCQELVVKSGI